MLNIKRDSLDLTQDQKVGIFKIYRLSSHKNKTRMAMFYVDWNKINIFDVIILDLNNKMRVLRVIMCPEASCLHYFIEHRQYMTLITSLKK